MNRILVAALCVAAISAAHAQVVCNTYGNQTTCDGSLRAGPPAPDASSAMRAFAAQQQAEASQIAAQAQMQQARAQMELARQQAEVAREQAAYIRQQRAALARQQAQAELAAQRREREATEQREAAEAARHQQAAASAGISEQRYLSAQARCRQNNGDIELCNQLTPDDVRMSEAAAGIKP